MDNKLKLQALAAAALALPGLALADDTPESATPPAAINNTLDNDSDFEFGYRFHHYSEDDIGPTQTGNPFGESTERYEIRANQFNLSARVNDELSFNVAYQHETMAGASAWFTLKDVDGNVTQVMSGASINDSRQDVEISAAYEMGDKIFALSIAASDEDDYDSLSFGGSFSFDFDQRLSTFALSADFSNDDIEPTDSDIFTYRVKEKSKHSSSVLAAISRVINKNSTIQLSVGYTTKSGYLSDPYKQVFAGFALLNDTRPERRISRTLSARYRYYVEATDGAFHADYRYYRDSWKIESNTFEFSYHQPLPWGLTIVPSLRFYDQDASYFYEHFYDEVRADGYHSTDYRLSGYGAETYSLTLVKDFDQVSFHLKAQSYRSGKNKGFASNDSENPALLDFELFTVGFDYRF